MKKLLSILIATFPMFGMSQTNCDSLNVNCCDVSLLSNDTITLTASNDAMFEIFDYPGFRLLDGTSTIVAQETVNYFGIGSFPQPHYLNVLQPVSLPFAGTLELWGGFYDTLYCTFNVTISTNGILDLENPKFLYPNPSSEFAFIEWPTDEEFQILSIDGKFIKNVRANQKISVQDLPCGTYFFKAVSGEYKPIKFVKF